MKDTINKSSSDQLTAQLERYPSLPKLQLMRNMSYGAGAACLVMITQLIEVGVSSDWLQWSLIASSIALTMWLCTGTILEYYILVGPKSYAHLRTQTGKSFLGGSSILSGLALIASIAMFLFHLLPIAAYIFGAAIFFAFAVSIAFHNALAVWYFRDTRDDEEGS